MKKLFIFISVLLIVLLLAYLSLFVFVNSAIKTLVANAKIEKYLNRQVTLGKFSVSGITAYSASNFSISKVPNFNAGLLASAKKIQIQTGFFKKEKLITFSLDVAGVNANISIKELANLPSALVACPVKFCIPIKSIILTSATVNVYQNEADTKPVVFIDNISLKIADLFIEKPFDFTASFKVINGNENFTVYSKCVFDLKKQEIQILDATIVSDNSAVYVKGKIAQIASKDNMNFDIEISGDKNVVNKIVNVFSPATEAELELKPKTKIHISGTLNKTLLEIEQ
ncbi:MAG: hypothetical protein M0Q46_04520 [Endomicrobiales bacterium]|nr:hypothetical protein [Endomicrobiales bacterium]